MSDGPHKTLPMRRHWKELAKRAATPAYSPAQVAEAFPVALKKEFREAPLAQIRDILGGGAQSSLFREERAAQLDAARQACRGSAAANTLIDCAQEANANGLIADAAFRSAIQNAIDSHMRAACHQIEEHFRREEPQSTANVRDRLSAARAQCPVNELASELMSDPTGGGNRLSLPKHTGIDEGPSL